ncbi:MAG: N-acetyl-gamma-glutamyl-phosphate reductase [Actinobacteria bacterium]|nr:N-acetyl-gamma-glutamyl-phosphate reductase [Cyanobacteriota bacterium]MCL5772239.1 N-acetyl-gamma-glutamyl-phosphate reductase [Actinomycetota bacterium]
MNDKIKVAIVGGSGYTGIELIKILDNHKNAEIKYITSRTYAEKKIAEVFPLTLSLKNNSELTFIDEIKKGDLNSVDAIFLCLPPGKSMQYVSEIVEIFKGKIIDLGADFRIKDENEYEKWYENEHILKEYIPEFVYGLSEINREIIKKAKYIANPGCYPTAALLALAPILKIKELKIESINIDSKSGVSGAGKKLKDEYLFLNIFDNFYAYSAINHRHIPEMEQEINKISSKKIKICFTPHILPLDRGIFSTIYVNLKKDLNITDLEDKIYQYFYNDYKSEIFVKFLGENIPSLKNVVGTNTAHIGFIFDKRTNVIKIFSAIDNILKGASGQAVQNMNIMFGFNEDEGLRLNSIYN